MQKTLPLFEGLPGAMLAGVLLDARNDGQAIRWCEKNNVPWQPSDFIKTKEGLEWAKKLTPDWLLSINSTLILSADVLAIPAKGALNLHPGKLPEYAGLHTHQWAIRNGETEFGVTVHHMVAGLDTGPIAFQSVFAISETDTGLSLYLKCIAEGTKLMQLAIEHILSGNTIPSVDQDLSKRHLYTNKMAEDGRIHWQNGTKQVLDFIRAADYAPFQSPTYIPKTTIYDETYFVLKVDRSIEVLTAGKIAVKDEKIIVGTGDGSLQLVKLKTVGGENVDTVLLSKKIHANEQNML